jgi:hypothetical protein
LASLTFRSRWSRFKLPRPTRESLAKQLRGIACGLRRGRTSGIEECPRRRVRNQETASRLGGRRGRRRRRDHSSCSISETTSWWSSGTRNSVYVYAYGRYELFICGTDVVYVIIFFILARSPSVWGGGGIYGSSLCLSRLHGRGHETVPEVSKGKRRDSFHHGSARPCPGNWMPARKGAGTTEASCGSSGSWEGATGKQQKAEGPDSQDGDYSIGGSYVWPYEET